MSTAPAFNLNFRFCPSLFPREPVSSIAATVNVVDATKVAGWLRQFETVFPRFERIAQNGLHSVLEKEIQDITPLLNEGQEIGHAMAHFAPTIDMINQLVRPRLAKLQQTYTDAQAKLSQQPEMVEKDAKLAKKWESLGLPASVLQYHSDCVRFLIESKLVFDIVGFKETCGDANVHDIKLDTDGHPMIKMQGRFVRWETIARELEYDPKTDKVKSRGYAGNIVQAWSYFHPQGLVPIDRFNYDEVFPVYELPQGEYDRLLALSKKFYEDNPEKDPGIPKDCIVQFFTSPRRQGIPEHPLLANLHRNAPVHIGVRLITADRKVYSFGYQMPSEEQQFVLSNFLSTFLATAETKVSMRDYEEFRDHEGRITTSIPLSSQRSQNIIAFLNSLNDKQLRFQFTRQNCSSLMQEVMQRAGYEVKIRTTAKAILLDALPYLNQFPVIGGLVGKVETCAMRILKALPKFISKPIKWADAIAFYIPRKIGTILTNLLGIENGWREKDDSFARWS